MTQDEIRKIRLAVESTDEIRGKHLTVAGYPVLDLLAEVERLAKQATTNQAVLESLYGACKAKANRISELEAENKRLVDETHDCGESNVTLRAENKRAIAKLEHSADLCQTAIRFYEGEDVEPAVFAADLLAALQEQSE